MTKPWLDDEAKYLKELYYNHYKKNEKEKINCKEITKLINKRFANDRSPQAIKNKAHSLKISKKYGTKTDVDDDNDYYDGNDNNEDSPKLGKINFENVKAKEEIKDKQPVKTTTISISNLGNNKNNNNENSVQTITTKIPEPGTPPITNATTTTKTTTSTKIKKLKKDLIEAEINYLKKRLDYLTEKLNNLEI
ncbi:hypothetical protein ACTFIY_006013 [Dictyostelium cf. discoideum]